MKTKLLLLLIVLFGFAIRVWQVNTLPSILNRDEAALAYNAYLLKETGKDEWGKEWPLTLESFGDFKLVGYPAVLIPFFTVFGENDLAVRLPSVIAGSILIVLAFVFAKQYKISDAYALTFSFLIAITPVFFFYSRMAYEANVALTYLVSIIIILLYKTKGKKRLLLDLLAVFLACIAVFTYNTPFLLLPFLILALPFLRGIKNYKNWIGLFLGLILVFLFAASVLIPLSSRKSGITIFTDETVWTNSVTYREQFSGPAQTVLGSKYVFYGIVGSDNLLNSFSPWFLVQNGGSHPWHSLPNHGHIYWIVYVFGMLGIAVILIKQLAILIQILKKKATLSDLSIHHIFLLYLLFISLLPSLVTVDAPHATRSLLFFFIFSFFAILGVQGLSQLISKKKKFSFDLILLSFILVCIFESVLYFQSFFKEYPSNQSMYLPGFDTTIQSVIAIDNSSVMPEKVVVIDSSGYHYILAAWYGKLKPEYFFETIVKQQPDLIGFRYGEKLANLHFIAHRDDRSEDEKVIVEWIDDTWRIIEL